MFRGVELIVATEVIRRKLVLPSAGEGPIDTVRVKLRGLSG